MSGGTTIGGTQVPAGASITVEEGVVVLEIPSADPVVIEVGLPGLPGVAGPVGPPGPAGPPGPSPGPITLTAAETIAIGDLVSLDTAGDVILADSTFATARWRFVGIATTAATATNPVDVQSNHGALVAATFAAAPGAAANGELVFLDDTAGRATLTPPVVSGRTRQIVGILQGADGLLVAPPLVLMPQFVSRLP